MKHSIITILLTLVAMTGWAKGEKIIGRTDRSITFVVDEGLSPCQEKDNFLSNGEQIAKRLLSDEDIPSERQQLVSSSFAGEKSLYYYEQDAFFRSVVTAYAQHRPVILSPDMIWLLIGQGFARYVNAHPEEMRDALVSHSDKMELIVGADGDSLDWPMLIDQFAARIDRHTKGNLAQILTSDFTTTGSVKRTASQITLMESVKAYFEFVVLRLTCGIPYITLEGTPADWQKLLDKTRQLEVYSSDFGQWLKRLEPILSEFVAAADGHPDQSFWQNIVMRRPLDKLAGGACSMDKPTVIDGWLLQFFPNKEAVTRDSVSYTADMPKEYVRVGFKYRVASPDGTLMSETPMELWSGFIGTEVDSVTHAFRPKIGWLVRKSDSEEDLLKKMKHDSRTGLCLRVREMPEILARMDSIGILILYFPDDVVIPDWFYDLKIRFLNIYGMVSDEVKARIWKTFLNARINGHYSSEFEESWRP